MKLKILYQTLDSVRHQNGEEYWYARDLWILFGYANWRNFQRTIEKAKESCTTSGEDVNFHFADVRKMKKIGYNKVERNITDYKLTRYACYLIAQNGDPRIPEIAFAQMYFAIQTRKQEVMEKTIEEIERLISRKKLQDTEKEFSKTLYNSGVDGQGIGEIRSAGDKVLFGGKTTQDMKIRLGLGHNNPKPLADVLPTITLKAKDLAQEMTTVNTKRQNLLGKTPIKFEHQKNNAGIRGALVKSNIYPENLPAAEDTKKIESRHKKQQKKIKSLRQKSLPT